MHFLVHRIWTLATLLGALAACAAPAPTPVTIPATAPTIALTLPTARATNIPSTNAPVAHPTDAPLPTNAPQSTTLPAPTQAPTSVPFTAQAAAPEAFFGVNTNGEILYDEQLRALAVVGGAQMVRTSISWKGVETNKGTYDWRSADSYLKTLLDTNFTPLVLILENPAWAANSPCGPVNDLPAFDAFLRRAVERYPRVKYWVLYNEPDNAHYPEHVAGGCFGGPDVNANGKADIHDYADQLRIAWRAVHQTNPNAVLVIGALAMDNFDEATAPAGYPGGGKGGVFNARFLQELLTYMQANPLANGERYFDVVSFNYYAIYGPYWQGQAEGIDIGAKTNFVRKLMRDARMDAPLMVGETGEDSYSIGNEAQSENGVKTFVRGLASQLTHVVWWTYQDFSDSSPPPSNTWKYGLLDQTGNPKLMYAAYQTVSKQLTGASFMQPLQVEGGEGYLFDRNGAGVGVVWSSSDAAVTIAFAGSVLQLTDMYGGVTAITDGSALDKDGAAKRIGVQVGKNPVYMELVSQ